MRILSSLQPDTIYFPFLGKCKEIHTTFASDILKAGAKVFVFHIVISPPEHVPKISE